MADRRGLTRDGRSLDLGMILGDPPTMKARLAALRQGCRKFPFQNPRGRSRAGLSRKTVATSER